MPLETAPVFERLKLREDEAIAALSWSDLEGDFSGWQSDIRHNEYVLALRSIKVEHGLIVGEIEVDLLSLTTVVLDCE